MCFIASLNFVEVYVTMHSLHEFASSYMHESSHASNIGLHVHEFTAWSSIQVYDISCDSI